MGAGLLRGFTEERDCIFMTDWKKGNIWNVPNVLTMIRLLLIPVYWVLFMQGKRHAALMVFLIASITDLLDGRIARKYNLITDLGKLMDPLADKLMVISVMLSLAMYNVIPWAALIILVAKEIIMVIGGMILLHMGVVVYSEMVGKAAQALMVASLILSFFADEFFAMGCPVHLIVLWCAVALTLCALTFYTRRAIQRYRAVKAAREE